MGMSLYHDGACNMFRMHKNIHKRIQKLNGIQYWYGPWILTMLRTFGQLDIFRICLCIQPQTCAVTELSCSAKSRKVWADTSVLSSWVGEHGNKVSSCGFAVGSKESETTSIGSADFISVPNKFSGIRIYCFKCVVPNICKLQCLNHEPQTNENYWAKEPLPSSVLAPVLPPTGSCWASWAFLAQQGM